jgi:hypothetical protein
MFNIIYATKPQKNNKKIDCLQALKSLAKRNSKLIWISIFNLFISSYNIFT